MGLTLAGAVITALPLARAFQGTHLSSFPKEDTASVPSVWLCNHHRQPLNLSSSHAQRFFSHLPEVSDRLTARLLRAALSLGLG